MPSQKDGALVAHLRPHKLNLVLHLSLQAVEHPVCCKDVLGSGTFAPQGRVWKEVSTIWRRRVKIVRNLVMPSMGQPTHMQLPFKVVIDLLQKLFVVLYDSRVTFKRKQAHDFSYANGDRKLTNVMKPL